MLVGTFTLFCAGTIGPVTVAFYYLTSDGFAPPLWIAVISVAVVILFGSVLVRAGHTLKPHVSGQRHLTRFIANLLVAIGVAWLGLTGVCTLIFLSISGALNTTAAEVVAASLVPLAIASVLCIVGWALRQTADKK